MQQHRIASVTIVALLCAIVFASGRQFRDQRLDEPLYPSPALSTIKKLSDFDSRLRSTSGDTEAYFFESGRPGGTVLILGGVHPNEPAGYIAAYILVENLHVSSGRIIVIPRANHSGFTHTDPGEATPASFRIESPSGERVFRVGSRITNPIDQWPDPEIYLHYPSGQALSGSETRNLNRAFPGRSNGSFTERVALAITELVKSENVDLVIDLHEASPEYPVIDAIVAHQRALDLSAFAKLNLELSSLSFSLEPSPENFHGLSHRELGDATPALATLMESANISQGRLRGAMTEMSIHSGLDDCYVQASRAGLVRVPYDSTGISLAVRVGRHLAGVTALVEGLAFTHPEKHVEVSGIPTFADLQGNGLGHYLTNKRK